MRPDYVGFDTKQREALLSQVGTFSPGERDVFHKLCQNWQEKLPYNRFTALLNHGDCGTPADLLSLMTKLREAHIGILRTTMKDGTRHRDTLVLREENHPSFFLELADELFVDMLESIRNPLPLLSLVQEQVGPIPPTALHPVGAGEIGQFFTGSAHTDFALAVSTLYDDALLVSPHNLRGFVGLAILKMRFFMGSTSVLEAVAKAMDSSLIALKQQIAGKDPGFWLSLTQTVLERRRELETLRNATVDPSFFHAATLLKSLIQSQMSEAKQKKKEQESRSLDLEAISLAIKEAPERWLEQTEVTRILETQKDKYEDQFTKFQEDFYTRYVQHRAKNALPVVVLLKRRYIHRDNLFPLFLEKMRVLEADLAVHFALQMEEQLKSGNRGRDGSFYSLANFNEAILQQVQARDSYVAALVEKPTILAEAMILHAKTNGLAGDVNQLKQRLRLYFDPETMQPLPLNAWFSLRLLDIFERAFEKLPILRRIWIRLTGRYESFRARYLGHDAAEDNLRLRNLSSGPAPVAEPRNLASHRRRRTENGPARSSRGDTKKPETYRGPAPVPGGPKRAYSRKQVDSAWDEFGNSIKKKP